MKFILIAALSLISFTTFAMNTDKDHKKMEMNMDKDHKKMEMHMDKMSFEDAKKMHMEMLEKKTAMVETNRKCSSEAKEKKDLKACMKEDWEKEREMRNSMKEEMKADMKDMKDKVKEKI